MEKFNLENFPTSESAKKMLSYVSDGFYDESYVGKWIFQAMGVEYDKALVIAMNLPAQFYPETATWGLMYHEIKWGLPVRQNLSYDERRMLIYQKRDYRAPMTPYSMEILLKDVTNFKIRVSDINDKYFNISKLINHPNRFQVWLTDEGTADIAKIKSLLDRVKQSHTVYDLMYYKIYKYNVKIKYENIIHIRTGFYPRYNLAFFNLDNTWKLDGNCLLNGYDGDSYLDFYPVSLWIQVPIKERVYTEKQLRLVSAAMEGIALSIRNKNQAEARASPEAAELFTIKTAVKEQSSAGPIRVMNLSVLDNEWKLDNGRKLNGGLTIL